MPRIAAVLITLASFGVGVPPAHAADDLRQRVTGTVQLGGGPTRFVRPSSTPNATLSRTSDGFHMTIPPCQYEDSNRCYWLAFEQGNGGGRSFVALNGDQFYFTPVRG